MSNVFTQDQIIERRTARRELQRWLVDRRNEGSDEQLRAIADLLTPIFQYLADGRANGQLETRAWLLLYSVRPDLLSGESMADFARYRGVSKPAVTQQLQKLLAAMPGLRVDTETRRGHASDKAASSARKSVAQLRRRHREKTAFLCSRFAA